MSTTKPTVTVEIDFTTDLSAGLAFFEKVSADGPYSWYRTKEAAGTSAADSSGNGLTGTYEGTVTLNQTSGKPVTGESASRYITLGSGGRIQFAGPPQGTTRVTLAAWVYRSTLDGNAATLYRIAESESGGEDWMSWAVRGDGYLHLYSGGETATTTTSPLAAATFYYVAVVMDMENNAVTFYVNGVAQTTSYALGLDQPVNFQGTGANAWNWGGYDGTRSTLTRIAEPAMYLEALQASQLLDHYNAAATTAFAGYTWTDVTDYVLAGPGINRTFGREGGTEDFQPSTVAYVLVNDDRRFEVGNADSPYYPNVEAGRPTRVQMTQDAVTYDWAFGFIEDFPQEWNQNGSLGRVQIRANDFLERMNNHELGSRTLREQAAGSRMTALANISGVPSAMRDIDAGNLSVMTQTVEGGTAGDHAKKVARTDRGFVYFDGRGYFTFQDGLYRLTDSRAISSQGLLGSVGSVDIVTLAAPVFHAPMALVKNEITVRRPGGVDQVAVDSASRSKRGPRSYSDELLFVNDTLAATRAEELLNDYKDPQLRVRAISFNPERSPGQWDHALGVQPSDRYTWVFEPQQGSSVTRDVFVEGVDDRWNGSEYVATWFLSVVPDVAVEAGAFRGLLALMG